MSLLVAACAYPIERLKSFDAFREKQVKLVREAHTRGAQLLVFPEYGSMELGALLDRAACQELARELEGIQAFLGDFRALYRELAKDYDVTLVAPSFPVLVTGEGEPHYRNRAYVFSPSGSESFQEKRIMTRFETELWGISAGSEERVFETEHGVFAIAICYDSEFPLLVRRLVEHGAQIILVPSCTDTPAGYHRVALSCRARALENQCYVVQAPTVGSAPWSTSVDENIGAAGIFAPPDRGFPADGVIALGSMNAPGWVFAELDLTRLENVRRDGQVQNHRDWSEPAHLTGDVTRVRV